MIIGNRSLAEDEIEGYVFDVDGTLVDTMPQYYPSWVVACKTYGLSMTEDQFWGYAGVPLRDITKELYFNKHGSCPTEEFIAQFIAAKGKAHKKYQEENGMPAAIGAVVEFAKKAVDRVGTGKVACATSGLRVNVEEHLNHLGIRHLFSHVVCAEDLDPGRGKPCPDIFLRAAELIGVSPSKCQAFEDGEAGFESAYKAGMSVMDVRYVEGYPLSPSLKKVMEEKSKHRPWLNGESSS